MKVILTSKPLEITSKTGKKYTILRGIASDGSTVETLISEVQAEQFKVSQVAFLSADEVAEVFKAYTAVDIQFDQRGRLVSIEE